MLLNDFMVHFFNLKYIAMICNEVMKVKLIKVSFRLNSFCDFSSTKDFVGALKKCKHRTKSMACVLKNLFRCTENYNKVIILIIS